MLKICITCNSISLSRFTQNLSSILSSKYFMHILCLLQKFRAIFSISMSKWRSKLFNYIDFYGSYVRIGIILHIIIFFGVFLSEHFNLPLKIPWMVTSNQKILDSFNVSKSWWKMGLKACIRTDLSNLTTKMRNEKSANFFPCRTEFKISFSEYLCSALQFQIKISHKDQLYDCVEIRKHSNCWQYCNVKINLLNIPYIDNKCFIPNDATDANNTTDVH